ncbi:YebC/PmpR family DNA-binding transcriptional regulator [Candidatus Neomicrothrix sp.]|jgi:YebC/PmpR family DNA-binding regulatory protein|uniref:YebC/PmpR family DNA-binding transcriptional regulator n=1 Tax=Candidatus Neomicrothrix sp. TaxID=2719034 RepID=UPI000E93670B|nr:YebC/PmpR family DNA-binding transcriptional regulator [Candidatus Microthrix sp.]HBX09669.1 YebC/PmpR family DNA-binding transcriptional regulator [Candidatus Microthrix parvicella]MBK6502873.1 YebC/PmpR family DNA-binding transcriptional regulator [Candidatus Microthrix sp.]MBK7021322.1 YebC/PmpR family DNA-binding transcriptional regulator [Candidatus Microthrix sp.]MBL0204974.1 YebC/PmpR family DNA-binding transcriptional regulator [Candidatus Microthrix sp.]MBP6135165.1 YebC/PmpR famil
MSGHSKWATIKHKKGAADAKRGKLFAKLIRQLEIAARSGGGDLDANPTLRSMYQKARSASVPVDTIERAIKRGTGELDGVTYEEVTYEGYGPHGVAIFVDGSTDNRNRTGAEIRSIFSKAGGSLAEPGAVAWQFERKGWIQVSSDIEEDDLMMTAIEAGADDVVAGDGAWVVTTDPHELMAVRDALEEAGVTASSAELTMIPVNTVELGTVGEARGVLALIEALEDHDDVADTYANVDVPDDVAEALAAE